MDRRGRSPVRLLAPIALIAFMLAFFAVIVGSDVKEDSDGGNGGSRQQQRANNQGDDTTTTTDTAPQPTQTFYTVKTGDTLAGISVSVGVPIETLQELNPDLDPQALVSGQKIRLKE